MAFLSPLLHHHRITICPHSETMSTNDDTQVLLQMVALSKRLSAKAGENVTNELRSLRQRDQENCAFINRLTKDKSTLLQQSEAAVDENERLKKEVESLNVRVTQAENDLDKHRRSLREATAKVEELDQYRVELKDETEDNMYVSTDQEALRLEKTH